MNRNIIELWEAKFLGQMRIQKLLKIIVPGSEVGEEAHDEAKNADALPK